MIYAGFGLLIACVINANIFGELQIILHYLGKDDKIFQNKLIKISSAMNHLKLPQQ